MDASIDYATEHDITPLSNRLSQVFSTATADEKRKTVVDDVNSRHKTTYRDCGEKYLVFLFDTVMNVNIWQTNGTKKQLFLLNLFR